MERKERMLTTEEILALLEKIPAGYREPDHEVIKRSNDLLLNKYKKMGVIIDYDEFGKEETQQQSQRSNKSIDCNEPGCNSTFENIADYQGHFNCCHRFTCSQCKRSLPTAHLLDLHLVEQHDSYFAAKVDRGTEPMYACYLQTCDKKMMTPEERKDHCITVHNMPANYRFDQMKKKTKAKAKAQCSSTAAGQSDAQQPMEVPEDMESKKSTKKPYIQAFSFGHHTERAFNTRGRANKQKQEPGKTLENLQELKDALPDVME